MVGTGPGCQSSMRGFKAENGTARRRDANAAAAIAAEGDRDDSCRDGISRARGTSTGVVVWVVGVKRSAVKRVISSCICKGQTCQWLDGDELYLIQTRACEAFQE